MEDFICTQARARHCRSQEDTTVGIKTGKKERKEREKVRRLINIYQAVIFCQVLF